MITPVIKKQFCQFLCTDVRFGTHSLLNDQCWALGSGISDPKAVSLVTTYGLRATRMHLFPQFSIEELVIQDPEKFYSPLIVAFSSASFVNLSFSPFPSLDVEYRVWVPTSQVLVGQLTCVNKGGRTLSVGIDWRVHLQPLQNGSPMKHAQAGLNTILQGECDGLYPVFYLTGGALPSISDYPGLGHKLLLMPGAKRHLTWAMASLTSLEESSQQARQYSSSSLEHEQIRIEMADNRVKVYCKTPQGEMLNDIQRSQDRAFQLLVPAACKHAHITYVSDREPDSGNYPSESILEAHPEWSGQTLPEIYLLSLTLLPGRPEVIKGLLQNFLKIQRQDGRIDLRASVNHNLTGHSSLPMLIALVSDLHQYNNDNDWIALIYPQLFAFLRTWLDLDESGNVVISRLTHPLQLSFTDNSPAADHAMIDLWMKLSNPQNPFLLSLLYREVTELLQIARLINRNGDIEWLEKVLDQLRARTTAFLNEIPGAAQTDGQALVRERKGMVLTSFTGNGLPRLKRNIRHAGQIYLRLTHEGYLPADFCCNISGFFAGAYIEKTIKARDLTQIGTSYVHIFREMTDFIESINIVNLPAGAAGEIGVVDVTGSDILDLMPLYAGIPSSVQVNRLLAREKVKSHLVNGGVSLSTAPESAHNLTLPSYITAMIIDGLVRYGKYDLAAQVFRHQFMPKQIQSELPLANLTRCTSMRIEDLAPLRLFLKLHGLIKLSDKEIIIAHHVEKQQPITVQYQQIELLLRHNLTEVRTQSGEMIYLNQPGKNRILLERTRKEEEDHGPSAN